SQQCDRTGTGKLLSCQTFAVYLVGITSTRHLLRTRSIGSVPGYSTHRAFKDNSTPAIKNNYRGILDKFGVYLKRIIVSIPIRTKRRRNKDIGRYRNCNGITEGREGKICVTWYIQKLFSQNSEFNFRLIRFR